MAPNGEVCKGTDFPGLLRAIERPPPRRHDRATCQADKDTTVLAAATTPAETSSHEEAPSVKVGGSEQGGETVSTDIGGGEETKLAEEEEGKEGKEGKEGGAEGKTSVEEEDEEAKRQKEREEAQVLVKSGTLKLLLVLGEETTAKVGGIKSGTS